VPYRFAATRTLAAPWWLALAMIPIGLLGGAGNEHTGVGLAIAGIACTAIAWSRDRIVPVWALTGLAALAAGYIALLTAPGQAVRYGGLANQHGVLERIVERGVLGNLGVVGVLLAWASPMLIIAAIVAGRRAFAKLGVRAVAGFAAVGAVMIVTALAAPRVPARMLVAPATMLALALGVFLVEIATDYGKQRVLRVVSLSISSLALAVTLPIFLLTCAEGRERMRKIETAPRGSVVCVQPYTFSAPTPFSWGDDFRSPGLMQRVARMYGLAGIQRPCADR
jgi:hypothetical protein